MTETHRRLVRADGAEISVEVVGSTGPMVVCWPAGGRPGSDLAAFASAVADAGYRVALIDPRGRTNSPGITTSVTLQQLAGDAATVIETLDASPAVIVGHAFGNRVMRCLAAVRPDLVAGVVLLAAGGSVPPENLADLGIVADPTSTADQREPLGRAFFEPSSDPSLWLTSCGPGAAELYRTCIQPPLDEWWHGGTSPMLVVQGGADRSAPPANGEQLAAAFGDRVRLITIPNAAHALPIDRPQEVAGHVVDWLRG